MSDLPEALGTAVEGGLLAHAVEPGAGKNHEADIPRHCANCGTGLIGPHCHGCGQKAELHRSLGAVMHDIVHGVLHLDGKLWRTLPLLAWRPGQITRRYIDGERARFVSPIAMFLFSVFAMFAVFQMVGITTPASPSGGPGLERGLDQARTEAEQERQRLTETLATLPQADPARAALEEDLAVVERGLAGLGSVEEIALADGDDGLNVTLTGIEALDAGIVRKWRENPGLMLYKLQTNSYKFSWLLIPLSIPFVWLLFFWKRRFKAYDHAIFVTYSLAFMSLLFIVLSILSAIGVSGGWLFAAFALVPPVHIYKQLRGTYALSRFSALWRLGVLMVSVTIILALFLQVLLLLGAF